MASDRLQRQIERLLDEAKAAIARFGWDALRQQAQAVLAMDPDNSDGQAFLATAERALSGSSATSSPQSTSFRAASAAATPADQPASFANGRQPEMERLNAALRDLVTEGRGGLVFITGRRAEDRIGQR